MTSTMSRPASILPTIHGRRIIGVTVHFKLTSADVEQNNVKGEKGLFLPRLDEIDLGRGGQKH